MSLTAFSCAAVLMMLQATSRLSWTVPMMACSGKVSYLYHKEKISASDRLRSLDVDFAYLGEPAL